MEENKTTTYSNLPKELSGAKPAYRDKSLVFANDIDKAAYIINSSQGKKKSSRHEEYLEWAIKTTNLLPEQISWIGKEIKRSIPPLYKKATANDEYEIILPDFYSQFKKEFEDQNKINQELSEDIVENTEEVAQAIEQPEEKPEEEKKKRSRGLTKKQEEVLRNILTDLLEIKNSLIKIKKNQEDRIAYEKKIERLNAERLAFAKQEQQLEAVPTEQLQPIDEKTPSEQEQEEKDETQEKPESSWWDNVKRSFTDIGKNALLTGGLNLFLGLGRGQETPTKQTTENIKVENNVTQQEAPEAPVPFAEGGAIQPIGGDKKEIKPLESTFNQSKGGETTYSREFKLDDLKSPLADVMKLPLKVAGAALLSAISNIAKNFGNSDPTITSEINLSIGNVAKAFGLQSPSINVSGSTQVSGSEAEYISYINNVSSELVSQESSSSTSSPSPTSPSPSSTPDQENTNPPNNTPTNQTTPQNNSNPQPTNQNNSTSQPTNQNGTGGPNNPKRPIPMAPMPKRIEKQMDDIKPQQKNTFAENRYNINLLNKNSYSSANLFNSDSYKVTSNLTNLDSFNNTNSIIKNIANAKIQNNLENIQSSSGRDTINSIYNQQFTYQNPENLKPVNTQLILPSKVINKNNNNYKIPEASIKTAKEPKTGLNYFVRKQILGSLM